MTIMRSCIKFIVDNWEIFSLIFTVLIEVTVFCIIRIRKKSKVDFSEIVANIPQFIAMAEEIVGAGSGSVKNTYVTSMVSQLMLQGGYSLKEVNSKTDYIKECIENILSTPQKKGAQTNEKIN